MTLHALSEVAAALGGLGGIGAIITSTAALLEARRTRANTEPNHGSSMADAIHRIEATQARYGAQIDGIGHEIADLRRTRDREHADYDARIRRLEAGRR